MRPTREVPMTAAVIDFREFPKQFLISSEGADAPRTAHGHAEALGGWRVQAAGAVPLVPIEAHDGARAGLLVGWGILGGRMFGQGDVLRLAPGGTVETEALPVLAGRAVVLWRTAGGMRLETDAGGFLPAVWSAGAGLAASTSTLIDLAAPHAVDAEAAGIFEFPRRRGFLPFGLTHHQGVRRLLPGHRLDLDRMTAGRVWPDPALLAAPPLTGEAAQAALTGAADRVTAQVGAVAAAAHPPRLYLSGGHDSRMVLAALRAALGTRIGEAVCETLVNAAPLDLHLARKAAGAAGARHLAVQVIPSSREEVAAWLRRAGWSFYDPVSELAATARAEDRRAPVMDGSGAEIFRASNWTTEDLEAPRLTRAALLARTRLPDAGVVAREAEAWLAALPPCPASAALDVAKIELIHGCWAGASIYGHDIETPSISPVASRAVYEAALRLPPAWKVGSESYRRWMMHLWPEGLAVPANRARGLDRLRFLKSELKRMVPAGLKRRLKPYR